MDSSTKFPESADPSPEADAVKVYAKDVGGVSQLFVLSDDGSTSQVSGVSASPGGVANSVQINDGSGGFGGDANLTYDGTTLSTTGGGPASEALLTVGKVRFNNALGEQVFEFEPDLYGMNIETGPSLDPGPGYQTVMNAGQLTVSEWTDSTFSTATAGTDVAPAAIILSEFAGAITPTITSTDGAVNKPLNFAITELQINGAAGNAGEVLTSQGVGAAPIWAAAAGGGTTIAKDPVRVATAAALPANSYAAGVLTADAGGDLNSVGIDGVTTLVVGDRVLVKDEATTANNLIYEITDLGAAGVGPATPVVPAAPTYPGALLTCGSGGTYATLTAAVAAAVDGDRIQILAGTIVEAATVTISKSVEVFGTGATCIVQRDSLTAVLTVTAPDVYLHDFAIVNNQVPSADPSGQSCCVNADTMNRTSVDGRGGLYFEDLTLTYPKVGVFISGTAWVVRGCTFAPNTGSPNTTIRALFSYGSQQTSFVYGNTFQTCTPGAAGDARLTAIYLNTRNDGIAPAWESGYMDSLVIDGNAITGGGGAPPRSYIDATSIYHQSGTATTFPPYGQFSLYIVNNNFAINHGSSPCVFFGRAYSGTPVLPLSFFDNLVVSDNSFGARVSSTQKGALFWTNTSGTAQNMGTFGGGFYGANNVIAPATLPVTVATVMADSSLLMVREIAYYNAPTPLLTLIPTVPAVPWSMTLAADCDGAGEFTRGIFASVNEGATNAATSWIVITPDPITVGVTAVDWLLFGDSAYAPATPADWAAPVPASIKQALDRLASAVAGLLGAPIP